MLVQILEDPAMGREGSYLIVILTQLLKNFPLGREGFIKGDNSSRVGALAEPGQRGCHFELRWMGAVGVGGGYRFTVS